jgi:molybdopterin-guanine dinucleotide biosynthesis protein A
MGRDKALLEWRGVPLALHVARRLAPAFSGVFISGDPDRYGRLGLPCVADAGGTGPLAGLWAALRSTPAPALFAVACDMPFVSPDAARALWKRLPGRDAAVPVSPSGPEPLHAFYARRILPAVGRALGTGAGPVALLALADVARVPAAEIPGGEATMADCDSQEELGRMRDGGGE